MVIKMKREFLKLRIFLKQARKQHRKTNSKNHTPRQLPVSEHPDWSKFVKQSAVNNEKS